MIDYILLGVIVSLVVIILLLLADRFFIIDQAQKEKDKLLEELSKAIKAIIAKNANEYVMTTSMDKVPSEEKPSTSPDEIPEESLSDDEFYDAVGKGLKK